MFNRREFKIGIASLGSAILISSTILQGLFNIFETCFWLVIAIIISYIGFIYVFMHQYRSKTEKGIMQKNKVLLLCTNITLLITFMGYMVELVFDKINFQSFAFIGVYIALEILFNMIIFYKMENSQKYKYIVFVFFSIVFLGAMYLPSYWIIFMAIPIITVGSLYSDKKYLPIACIVIISIVLHTSIYKLDNPDEGLRVEYFKYIYFVAFAIYVTFSICAIRTSRLIRRVNKNKVREVEINQENSKQLSDEVLMIGKNIKGTALKTNMNIEEIELVTIDSIALYDKIEKDAVLNVSSAIEQQKMTSNIVDMINKMKIEVNNALDSTEFSSVVANNSKESVQQLKDKSHVINESNKELAIAIDKFITNIKQIKSIVAGIVDISEQTDLLALNASIESSRAGEVGKGFAVVASQIRGLADENAKLTDNIYKLIEVLEKNTIRVRKVVDEVISSVEEENENIDNTYAYIENMGNNIRGLSSNINSILKKIEMINEYSKDIEEQSSDLVESSNLVKDRTQNAVQLNKDNKTKTEKTKALMDELVKEVKELDMYI